MFDVFLSHNSRDKAAVEAVAARLRAEAGIEPFLDKWHLIPGESWQPALEDALNKSTTVAVFIGPSGISPWHNEEVQVALSRAVRTRDEYRVIPVLLPGGNPDAVTGFLAQRTWVDFRSGLDKDEPFQRLVTGVKGVARASESFALPDEPAPYRGLFKFERQHADRFFGREREVEALLGRLERSSFEAVIGASGAGKSSLVLAGVLPRLDRFRSWPAPISTLVLTPGRNPVRALADQAAALLPPADRLRGADELETRMLQRTDGLRSAVATWTASAPGTLVLVIDQLEELFTHAAERGGANAIAAFAANLRDVVQNGSGQLRILATVRADFVDRCLQVEALQAMLQDHDFFLGPLKAEGLRDAIVRPAAACGALFETGVVSALLKELDQRPGMLPLLEHALDLLWRARRGVWLTSAALEAMGGVAGALKKHADACWQRLPQEDRPVARDICLRLVSPGEGAPDTRRRVELDELYTVGASREQVDRALLALSGPESRLLVVDGTQVEVAHEVLIQEWPTLRGWVDGARRRIRIHRRVTEAAREWSGQGRAPPYLLTGARLLEAEESFGPGREGLNQLEADLVVASAEARDHEIRRERDDARRLAEAQSARARVLRRSLMAVGALTAVAVAVAVYGLAQRAQADHERRLARSRELAGAALRQVQSNPQAALLLIQEAYRLAPTESVTEALRTYRLQPGRISIVAHRGWVLSAAFSPDGKRVVTAGYDGTARVWDAASGHEQGQMEGHRGPVWSVAYSQDGKLVVTAGKDGTARLWDAANGQEQRQLEGHLGEVRSAAFSPDGKRVVTAGGDGTARVWDAASGQEQRKLQGHHGGAWSAAFSLDGKRVVTAGADGTARLWDAANGQEQRQLEGHRGAVWSAAFSPDGKRVVTAGKDGTARVWDAASGQEQRKLEGHRGVVWSAAYSPDGKRVMTAGDDGTARAWDAASGQEQGKLEGHRGVVWSAAFSPDGKRVVTAGEDGTARVWDAASGYEQGKLEGHRGRVWSAAYSPDGKRVVTAGEDGTARVWDAASGQEQGKLEGHRGWVLSAAYSPDGKRVVTAGYDGTARVWDAASGQEQGKLEGHRGRVRSAVYSPDGKRVVTAGYDGTARVWDAASRQEQGNLEGHRGWVLSAAYSPDGKRVLTAGEDGTARVWDAASGQEQGNLEGHRGWVLSAAYSPDGKRVVTVGYDETARVWDAVSGQEQGRLEGHRGLVWSAVFSPDGKRVVTAGEDGTARVWDAASGQEQGKLEGHRGAVWSAAFSPDGKQVVTAGDDGTARTWPNWMWEPADGRLLQLDAGRSFTCGERHRLLNEDTCPEGHSAR